MRGEEGTYAPQRSGVGPLSQKQAKPMAPFVWLLRR
jgi:hypothetical protein